MLGILKGNLPNIGRRFRIV